MIYTADDSQFQVHDEQIPDLAGWHRSLEWPNLSKDGSHFFGQATTLSEQTASQHRVIPHINSPFADILDVPCLGTGL